MFQNITVRQTASHGDDQLEERAEQDQSEGDFPGAQLFRCGGAGTRGASTLPAACSVPRFHWPRIVIDGLHSSSHDASIRHIRPSWWVRTGVIIQGSPSVNHDRCAANLISPIPKTRCKTMNTIRFRWAPQRSMRRLNVLTFALIAEVGRLPIINCSSSYKLPSPGSTR